MTHPIIDDLSQRYTTKSYNPRKIVSQENLNILFEALRLSASSINSQPWRFIVIESDDAKKRLLSTFGNQYQFNQAHILSSTITILFAHHTKYQRNDYKRVIDKSIKDNRITKEQADGAMGAFFFAEQNTDKNGNTSTWTQAQTYLALGNAMHTLARLKIDCTPMEGIDTQSIQQEFKHELGDYQCHVALAVGYHQDGDMNAKLPKSRLALEDILFKI